MTGEASKISGIESAKADKSERARSTIEFPYTAQDDAEALAKGVRDVGATSCDWDQLAGHLNFAANGGGFRLRMIGAKAFGLLTYERGRVELTDLGIRILDPRHARAARVESFLSVPLYKAAFEKLRGQPLPPVAAIERLLENLGVAPKQRDKARQVFMRSAKNAGFMEIAADRLTVPPNIGAQEPDPKEDRGNEEGIKPTTNGSGGGGGSGNGSDGGDGNKIPAALIGLLEKLPPVGTRLLPKRRAALVEAFKSSINFLYPEEEEDGP